MSVKNKNISKDDKYPPVRMLELSLDTQAACLDILSRDTDLDIFKRQGIEVYFFLNFLTLTF